MRRTLKCKTIHSLNIIKRHSGFTLIELCVALVLLSILIVIAAGLYLNYINNAKVIVAQETVKTARDNINLFNVDYGKYPDSINFTDCVDENSRPVFTKGFCDELKENLHSINYNYNDEKKLFVLTGRAKDRKLTIITASSDRITR